MKATCFLMGVCLVATQGSYALDLRLPYNGTYECTQNVGDGPTHDQPSTQYDIDFDTEVGAKILAAASGTVKSIQANCQNCKRGWGNYVLIDHGSSMYTIYAHLSQVDVMSGDKVAMGERIGLAGNTGFSTSPHLHFGVHSSLNKSIDELRVYSVEKDPHSKEVKRVGWFESGKTRDESDFICQFSTDNGDLYDRSGNLYQAVTPLEMICNKENCDISSQAFSSGEVVGWYPRGDCVDAEQWFSVESIDGVRMPTASLEQKDVCLCK